MTASPAGCCTGGRCCRSPGTREAPGPDGVLPLLDTSDEARAVRSDGWEDLALATAFEIGRLLALAEPSVVAALLLWRKHGLATARQAALLAAEPALAALGTADVGSGFAARAGLRLLTALGADDARRLSGRAGPVRSSGRSFDAAGLPTVAAVLAARTSSPGAWPRWPDPPRRVRLPSQPTRPATSSRCCAPPSAGPPTGWPPQSDRRATR